MRGLSMWRMGLCTLASLACGCPSSGDLDELQGDVIVEVRGRLVSATAGGGDFSGVSITVQRVSTGGLTAEHVPSIAPTSNGSFSVADVAMTPWEETYAIDIRDSRGNWQPRSLTLFSLTSGVIDYGDIALSPVTGELRSRVSGTLVDAISLEPVGDVTVRLVGLPGTFEGASKKDGTFSVQVPASRYRLELDADGLKSASAPSGWVSETGNSARLVNVPAEPEAPLGRLLLAPATAGKGVTLILSAGSAGGDPRAQALARECEARLLSELASDGSAGFTTLTLPSEDFDLNHAPGQTLKRWGPEGPLRPDGFGAGTSFWPSFLGSQQSSDDASTHAWDAPRVLVGRGYTQLSGDSGAREQVYRVSDRKVVTARSVELPDQRIESFVIEEQSPVASFPEKLAYYYNTGTTSGGGGGGFGEPVGEPFDPATGDPIDPGGDPVGCDPADPSCDPFGPGGDPGFCDPADPSCVPLDPSGDPFVPPGEDFPSFDGGLFPDGGDFFDPTGDGFDPFAPEEEPPPPPEDRYPVGVMMQAIAVECWDQAEVRAYQNNRLFGSYRYERAPGAGASSVWAPLLVEYGYTKPSPSKQEDLYLRVLPVFDLDLHDAEPVQGYEAHEVRVKPEEWTSLPKDLGYLGGTVDRVYFGGTAGGSSTKGLWWVQRNGSPGQSASWPSDAEVLAVYGDDFGTLMAVRTATAVKILSVDVAGSFVTINDDFDTDACGKPQTLGRLQQTWVVGTTKGLFTTDCTRTAEGVDGDLLRNYVNYDSEADRYVGVSSFARFRAARVAGDWVFIGTEGGVYAANLAGPLFQSSDQYLDSFDAGADADCSVPDGGFPEGQGPHPSCEGIVGWNLVQSPNNEFDLGAGSYLEPVVGFASMSNDLLYATRQLLFLDLGSEEGNANLVSMKTTIAVLELGKEADGNSLSSEITALAAFGGNVYIGTNIGIYRVDLVGAAACEDRAASSECLLNSLVKLEGFPTVKIKKLVTGADRFFALTEDGLYELRSTRPQIYDPTTPLAVDGVSVVLGRDHGFADPGQDDGGLPNPDGPDAGVFDAGGDLDAGVDLDAGGDLDAAVVDASLSDAPASDASDASDASCSWDAEFIPDECFCDIPLDATILDDAAIIMPDGGLWETNGCLY